MILSLRFARSLIRFFFCAPQIDTINELQLLTAKPVIYLVNLSERDYIRKKNKWSVYFLCCVYARDRVD